MKKKTKQNRREEKRKRKKTTQQNVNRIEYNIIYIIAVTVAGSQLYNIGIAAHTTTVKRARNLDATQAQVHVQELAGKQAGI